MENDFYLSESGKVVDRHEYLIELAECMQKAVSALLSAMENLKS